MLLAVEGGGFFTSSATGYSKGLSLLLLGRKDEEKPMRVSPWNHYQLVAKDIDSDFQLASGKNRVSHGCGAFICFGCAASELEGPSPPKVEPIQQQDQLTKPSVPDEVEAGLPEHEENGNEQIIHLKSSLKKPSDCVSIVHNEEDLRETLDENQNHAPDCTQKRKVQWTDECGKELVEIREFELSDEGEDFEGENARSCVCAIM